MKYVHTNLITDNYQRLSEFYQQVFDCVPLPPERDLDGDWLSRGTGVSHAHLRGVHLRLPGHGPDGPTLEIFQYDQNLEALPPAANRKGFGHLAFEVEDVALSLKVVLSAGGRKVGEVVRHKVPGKGALTFVYAGDPDGNLLELQRWD